MTLVATLLLTISIVSPPPQAKPVCDLFTDAEIADFFAQKDVKKQALIDANSCTWTARGFMFMASRYETEEPEELSLRMDHELKSARPGEVAKEEPGLGQRAIMTTGPYGRSVRLLVAAGKTMWTFVVDKVDQKLDMAATQPKLRSLAAKAVR